MKKLAKLLAFVIAFAMVASIVVMPVSAADTTGLTNLSANTALNTEGNVTQVTYDSSTKVSTITNSTEKSGVARRNSIVPQPNSIYYVTAMVKDADGVLKASTTVSGNCFCCYGYKDNKVTMLSKDNTVGTDWKKVEGYIVTLNNECGSHLKPDNNHTPVAEGGAGRPRALHIGFKFTSSGTDVTSLDSVEVKDFAVYKIPALTITAGDASTTYTQSNFSFTTSATPAELPTVVVKNASDAVEGTATVTATEAGYDVAVTGLKGGSTYNVVVSAKDAYGQEATATKTITTEGPVAVNKATPTYAVRNAKNASKSTIDNDNKIVNIVLDEGKTTGSAGPEKQSVLINANTTYFVSIYAKFADDVDASKVSATANIYPGHICYSSTLNMLTKDNVVGTEWKKFSGYVMTSDKGTLATDPTKCKDHQNYTPSQFRFHMGMTFSTNANTKIEYKDFVIFEVQNTTATAAVEATVNSATIEYTYSAPATLTAADVVLSGIGNAAVVKNSDTSYTVSISGLAPNTAYAVTATAKDYLGFPVANTAEFTTDSYAAPKTDFVIVAQNAQQEGNPAEEQKHEVIKTETGWTVKKSTSNLGSGIQCINNKVDKGVYLVSAKVRNLDETPNKSAKGYAFVSIAGNSQHNIMNANIRNGEGGVVLGDNEWHTVYAILDIAATTATCNCKDPAKCEKANSFAHFGVKTDSANKDFEVADLTLRKISTLIFDANYRALATDNGDGTATIYIANPKAAEGSAVYVAAATYAQDGSLADVDFAKVSNFDATISYALTVDVADTTKIMIWDGNMKPLHNTFFGSDL